MTDRDAFGRWLRREMERIGFSAEEIDNLHRSIDARALYGDHAGQEWTAPPTTPEVEALCAEMMERFRNAP